MSKVLKFMTFAMFLTEKSITGEDFEGKSTEEQRELYEEHSKNQEGYINQLVENKASKEEIDSAKEELKTIQEREDKALRDLISKHGVAITKLLKNLKGGGEFAQSEKEQIANFISENAEKIQAIKAAGSGLVSFETKAPAVVTTANASNPDGIPEIAGVQMAAPGNVNLRGAIVDGLVTSFNTNLSAYPYTDSLPKEGDFDWVGEGAVKPQMDLTTETRYAQPKKIAAWVKLTDEAVQDIPGMQSIATNYLRAKHDLKRQNGILFGTGAGDEPTGATVYGRLFVAGGMANKVTTPNFMDTVNAAITDIYTTHNYVDEMNYMANLVLVNPIDFYVELVAAKDGEGRPLYPMASLFNRVQIGQATIIPEESIPAGKLFVSDMSKYNVTNYIPYSVQIGWVNDDFIKNQFVILGESRLHAFVKHLDEQAFIYDDIAIVKAAITAP